MNEPKKNVRSISEKHYDLGWKSSVEDVDNISCFNLSEEEHWKNSSRHEIINVKSGNLDTPGFDLEELEIIVSHNLRHWAIHYDI